MQGNLDPLALIAGGAALKPAVKRILDAFAGPPAHLQPRPRHPADTPIAHVEQLVALVKGKACCLDRLSRFLGAAYLWVKAAHVTFVIFWMAGLFMVPRYYIHHHATTPGSAEDRAWIEREDRARTIILTPAMLVIWTLGLMLAVHLGAFDQALVHRQAGAGRAADRLSGLDRRLRQEARRADAPAGGPDACGS